MGKLKRLKISHFRNVTPGTELVFADGFNVLLGKNGTGKTTLLRLIEAVTLYDFGPFRTEAFSIEFEWASKVAAARIQVENERLDLGTVEGQVQKSEGEAASFVSSMRAEVLFGSDTGQIKAIIQTKDGKTTTQIGDEVTSHPQPALPTGTGFHTYFFSVIRSKYPSAMAFWPRGGQRFDESLGFYEYIKKDTFPVFAFLEKPGVRFSPSGYLFCGKEEAKDLTPQTLSFKEEHDPFIELTRSALGTKNVEIQLTLLSKAADGEAIYGYLRFWLTRRDGSQYSDEYFSFGQKRLTSFLYYLAANSISVIADELVNGLHHDWIDLCVHGIGERQAFLTSQNPLLMDYLSFNSVEEVQRSFILCALGYEKNVEILRWRNMTDNEAKSVFEASIVGIEHLSTILRNEGLW